MAGSGPDPGDPPEGTLSSPEVPDADAAEQQRPLTEDAEEADPETVVGLDAESRLAHPPLEVNEDDLVEQSVEVPFDDDEVRE